MGGYLSLSFLAVRIENIEVLKLLQRRILRKYLVTFGSMVLYSSANRSSLECCDVMDASLSSTPSLTLPSDITPDRV